ATTNRPSDSCQPAGDIASSSLDPMGCYWPAAAAHDCRMRRPLNLIRECRGQLWHLLISSIRHFSCSVYVAPVVVIYGGRATRWPTHGPLVRGPLGPRCGPLGGKLGGRRAGSG